MANLEADGKCSVSADWRAACPPADFLDYSSYNRGMPTARSIPRLVRGSAAVVQHIESSFGGTCSPHDVLSRLDRSVSLAVKRSRGRFFMYEENRNQTELEQMVASPVQLADLLHSPKKGCHYYWTSPIADVAPKSVLREYDFHKSLHQSAVDHSLLDPRGPSLWMGTSGSGTQFHYDVAETQWPSYMARRG